MTDATDIPLMSRQLAVPLFAGLCCLVVAVFVFGGAGLLRTWAAIHDDRQVFAAFDARLRAINGEAAPAAANASAWIKARTAAVAAATIQKVTGDIVAAAGGTVREVQVLQPEGGEPAQKTGPMAVSADFLLETTHEGLRRILMGLAETQPVLQTDSLSIQALPNSQSADALLRVEVKITGYWAQAGA